MRTDETDDDRDLDTLLRHLDHQPPAITAEQVIARARAGRSQAWRRAAGVLLALALAGAAYAVPGSPLSHWIESITGAVPAASSPGPPARQPRQFGGVEIAEPVTAVEVQTQAAGGFLRVELVDGDRLVARAPEGSARFTAAPGRLIIELLRADTIELLVPRTSPLLEVTAGHRLLLRKQDTAVTTSSGSSNVARYEFPLRR